MSYDLITITASEQEYAAIAGYAIQDQLGEYHQLYSLGYKSKCIKSIPELKPENLEAILFEHLGFEQKVILCKNNSYKPIKYHPSTRIQAYHMDGRPETFAAEISEIYYDIKRNI